MNDSLINSNNIKIKLETQIHVLKSKSKNKNIKQSTNNPKKIFKYSNSKNKIDIAGLINLDEKISNSLISSNISVNCNKYKLNQNINSYLSTPETQGMESPRYTHVLMRSKSNDTNNININDSSRENTLKENNILPVLNNMDKEKSKNNQTSKSITSGKKLLYETKKYKSLYGFNKNHGNNKNRSVEKFLGSYASIENGTKKSSREIEEKIFDQNFKDIIKCDEMLRGKEMNEFKIDNNANTINTLEINKKINFENNNNSEILTNINISKEQKINNNNKKNNKDNKKMNRNQNNNNNIYNNSGNINSNDKNTIKSNKNINNNNFYVLDSNYNDLDNDILKSESNNIIQNSLFTAGLSTGQIVNSGYNMNISVDESGSFYAYDSISKMLSGDDYKISYDIKNENIEKYEDIKNDFILFYNNEYINSVNDEMLILEVQLLIDKILEMQYIYKNQCNLIQKNFEIYRKKIKFFQKVNLLMNKKMNKLTYEKLKNKFNEDFNELYYNNKRKMFHNNKNSFKTNELSLWNNITKNLNETEVTRRNKNIKKHFQNIFLFICNKNINNLNALSKKYVLEFIEKEKEKEKEKIKVSNTLSNYSEKDKKKEAIFNSNKKKHISNTSRRYFNNNSNNNIRYKNNKFIKSNEARSKKDIFQYNKIENDNLLLYSEKRRTIKFKKKSNDYEGFKRNTANKNSFNQAKSLSKKINYKK